MAHHGQPLPRHGGLLRRRQGRRARVGSRLQRAEERLRLRRPLPRAVRHAAARRARQEQRRALRSSSRRPPSSEADCHAHIIVRLTRAAPAAGCSSVAALGLLASAVSTQGPRFYPDDPIAREPESQDASKAQPYEHRIDVRDDLQPVRHGRLQAVGHARAEHQHDRRSARLELVHQPHRHEPGHRRGDSRAARSSARRPIPSHWMLIREKTSGAHPGFTAQGRQGRDLVPRVRSARTSRKAATGAVAVATKIFWALGYNQVESFLTTFDPKKIDDRSEGDDPPPDRQADAVHAATTSTRSSSSVARRAGRHLSRRSPAACCPARSSAASATQGTRPDDPNDLVPHEHRRELRALRVFGAWTNLTDLKAANTLDTLVDGERPRDRQALPAGRRLDVRHVQRPARVGPELGALLPGRHDAEAASSRSASR